MHKGFTACLAACIVLTGCASVNLTAPLSGKYITAIVTPKNFIVMGNVSVQSTETHKVGPFGLVREVKGSKINYTDLMAEAARLDADDIIDVRIEMNTGGKTSFLDWLKGWERVFTYTGNALAVVYADKDGPLAETDIEIFEPESEQAFDVLNR
jgi:hypothetical protein